MKAEKFICYTLVFFIMLLISACEKMETRQPLGEGKTITGKIGSTSVVNGKGYAIITYEIPKVEGVKYVLAEYKINNTVLRRAKASVSVNQIKVEGFHEKGAYEVKLYLVNAAEQKSEPVSVAVNPDTPPYETVFKSLKVQNTFGGVAVSFDNPDTSSIAIGVVTMDKQNMLYTANTLYTVAPNGVFATRGFDNSPRRFGVYVRDKFNNYSDTLYGDFVPLLERQLDKSKFRVFKLPNDTPESSGWVLFNIWDNNLTTGYHSLNGNAPIPSYITFDLGAAAELSRFKVWQRPELYFEWGNLKEWTMWGSNNPNPKGDMDESWVKLVDCVSKKPSKGTSVTAEDKLYAAAGEEFEFPIGIPAFRYIRMELKRSWSDSPRFHFMEITIWGN